MINISFASAAGEHECASGCASPALDLTRSADREGQPQPPASTSGSPGRLLCWRRGCNQYFASERLLRRHFQEIHAADAADAAQAGFGSHQHAASESRTSTFCNFCLRNFRFGIALRSTYYSTYCNYLRSIDYICSSHVILCV